MLFGDAVDRMNQDGILILDHAKMSDTTFTTWAHRLFQTLTAEPDLPMSFAANWGIEATEHCTKAADPAYDIHSDYFAPTFKVWYVDSHCSHTKNSTSPCQDGWTTNSGPLSYAKGTHLPIMSRLKWLYRTQMGVGGNEWGRLLSENKKPTKLQCDDTVPASEFGFTMPKPIVGPKHLMIIADTRGLHCRGVAVPFTVRKAWRPIGPYFLEDESSRSSAQSSSSAILGSLPRTNLFQDLPFPVPHVRRRQIPRVQTFVFSLVTRQWHTNFTSTSNGSRPTSLLPRISGVRMLDVDGAAVTSPDEWQQNKILLAVD